MSTNAELVGGSHLYTSADIVIQNPVNACVIFVSAILVSAFLEFVTLFVETRVENRSAKTVVDVVTQEVTIVGVVALLIMIAQAALPEDPSSLVYSRIFTLANICLFFMASLFVLFVVGQFAVGALDLQRWKRFEEGRMDGEEVQSLYLRERNYKLAADRFSKELERVYRITLRDCPFYEAIEIVHKKLLVKLSNLSFRVWLAMSVVVLSNFGRAMLLPWSTTAGLSDFKVFLNALFFMGFTGYFILLLFLMFCLHLRSKFNSLLAGELPVMSTIASELVLFKDPMACIELIQCVVMSINYFLTLFVTGIIQTVPFPYSVAVGFLFVIPYVATAVLCYWSVWVLSIMSLLGSLHKKQSIIQRVVNRIQGEADVEDDSDLDDFSDKEASHAVAGVKKMDTKAPTVAPVVPSKKKKALKGVQKLRFTTDDAKKVVQRPVWLDPDDYWDGQATIPSGGGGATTGVADAIFYNNVDMEELTRAIRQNAPQRQDQTNERARENDDVKERSCADGKKRPVWLDSDEDLETPLL